jgi:hypothetical protein
MRTLDGLSSPTTKKGRGQRLVLDLLLEHQDQEDGLPTSIRFVFYELEQAGDATKLGETRRSHGWPPGSQDIVDYVRDLREFGVVPWNWIVDETRTITEWNHAATVREYMLDRLKHAVINPWGEEPPPLIICESRATAGVLRTVVSEYVCPITGTAGQTNGFLVTEVAPLLMHNTRRVLYLGDLDFSGAHIEANTRRVLERAAGREIGWERLGMLAEQATERGIEPIWKRDGRNGRTYEAIEVEALGQAGVIAVVRGALDAQLPEPLDDVQEREDAQRAEVRALLEEEER